jgi:hypothetical protein
VRGMQMSLANDHTLTGHTDVLYDGLYAYLSREKCSNRAHLPRMHLFPECFEDDD